MSSKNKSSKALYFTFILLAGFLSGCNDGGSSGGGNVQTVNNGTTPIVFSGQVAAAPVANAIVDIYTIDVTSGDLTRLGSTTTDSDGLYSLSVTGSGPFLCLARAGDFIDEATASSLSLSNPGVLLTINDARDNTIETIFGSDISSQVAANINPLTTLISAQAQTSLITSSTTSLSDADIAAISNSLGREFGIGDVDVRQFQALDFTNSTNAATIQASINSPETLIGLLLASLSQLAANTQSNTVVSPIINTSNNTNTVVAPVLLGNGVDPLELLNALRRDLKDGAIDGREIVNDLAEIIDFNGDELAPDLLTTQLQAALQSFINNSRNRSATTANDFQLLISALGQIDETANQNIAPRFDKIADQTVQEDSSTVTIDITNLSPGSDAEITAGQTVSLAATTSRSGVVNIGLVQNQNNTQSLTISPVANATGSVVISVVATDDGGTANGGFDRFRRRFRVTLTPVNDAPELGTIAAQTLNEDTTLNVAIPVLSAGPANESHQNLTVTATSDNTSLLPNPTVSGTGLTRTVNLAPASDASGTAMITVTVQDDAGTANGGVDLATQTFMVTVNAVNDQPSFDDPGTVEIFENTENAELVLTGFSAGPTDEAMQMLMVTATSSDDTILPAPMIAADGEDQVLTFGTIAPVSADTTVTLTITVQDDGGNPNGGIDTFIRQIPVVIKDLPVVSNIRFDKTILSGTVEITYTLTSQPNSASEVDIIVEYDNDANGGFTRASQAGAATADGISGTTALAASATGVDYKFRWNLSRDLPGVESSTARVRIGAARARGKGSFTVADNLTVRNSPTFGTTTAISTGGSPANSVARDMNADGKLDIVTANSDGSAVLVLLQSSSAPGTFLTPVSTTVGMDNISGVDVGDFNRDGKIDIIATDSGGNVSLLIQDTNNFVFSVNTTINVGGTPGRPIVDDYNFDGLLDILVSTGNNLAIIIGNGAGALANTNTTFAIGDRPQFNAITRVHLDSSNNRLIYIDQGDSALRAVELSTGLRREISSAFKGSGDNFNLITDFALDSSNQVAYVLDAGASSILRVNLSTGVRTTISSPHIGIGDNFQSPGSLNFSNNSLYLTDTGARSVIQIDVNSGNRVTISDSSNQLQGQSLNNPTRFAINGSTAIAIDNNSLVSINLNSGDRNSFNVSGLSNPADIVFDSSNNLYLIYDAGNQSIVTVPTSGGAVTLVSDANQGMGTSLSNPISLAVNNTTVYVAETSPQSVLTVDTATGDRTLLSDNSVATTITDIAYGDVNSDGRGDIVVAESGQVITILAQTGTLAFQPDSQLTPSAPATRVKIADVDRDGRNDILSVDSTANQVSIFYHGSSAGQFDNPVQIATGMNPTDIIATDLDGDSRRDLLAVNQMDSTLSYFVQNSTARSFQAAISLTTGMNPTQLTVADLNDDGTLDALTSEPGSMGLGLIANEFPLRSDPGYAVPTATEAGSGISAVRVIDLNGDGKLDLVTVNRDGNSYSTALSLGNGHFETKMDVPIMDSPRDIAMGDLNGDGLTDLAIPANSTNKLFIALSDASMPGTLTTMELDPGNLPSTVAIADFNNDGLQDLAVGLGSPATIVLMLQDSAMAGTFLAATDLGTLGEPRFILGGDVNNDGFDDLIYANDGAAQLSVQLQNPTNPGFFLTAQSYSAGFNPAAGVLADLNNDRRLDVAVVDDITNTLRYLIQNRGGTLNAAQILSTESGPNSVAAVDLNNDGKLDLLTANERSDSVSIYQQTGRGSFSLVQHMAVGRRPKSVTAGDIDGDSLPDIVVANPITSSGIPTVSIFIHTTTSQGFDFLTPTGFASLAFPTDMVVADFNGDGNSDIVVNSELLPQIGLMTRIPGVEQFGPAIPTILNASANQSSATRVDFLSTGDINADGQIDIIGTYNDPFGASLVHSLTNAGGAFTGPSEPPELAGTVGLSAIGDVNGDGMPDLITPDTVGNRLIIYLTAGLPDLLIPFSVITTGDGPTAAAIADLNSDGFVDIVSANRSSLSVILQDSNAPGTFLAATDFMVTGPEQILIRDMNKDGKLDLVTCNGVNHNVSILLQDSNMPGSFLAATSFRTGSVPVRMVIADLNEDGLLDIATANEGIFGSDDGSVSVLFHDRDNVGQLLSASTFRVGSRPSGIGAVDIDQDGRLDLLVSARNSSQVFLLKAR